MRRGNVSLWLLYRMARDPASPLRQEMERKRREYEAMSPQQREEALRQARQFDGGAMPGPGTPSWGVRVLPARRPRPSPAVVGQRVAAGVGAVALVAGFLLVFARGRSPAAHVTGVALFVGGGILIGLVGRRPRRRERRSGVARLVDVLGLVLFGTGFVLAALAFAPVLTAPRVSAVNESCTTSPARCVAGWDQDGRHYTATIGPSHVKGEDRDLSVGARNDLPVRDGEVQELNGGLFGVGFALGFGGAIISAAGGAVRRGRLRIGRFASGGADRRTAGEYPGDYRPL